MGSTSALKEPAGVLYRLKRGLSAYVSYLAACEMNESFSEYVLYEPILRILTARNYIVQCEVECPGMEHAAIGDRKRLDFVARNNGVHFALEVKWAKSRNLDVSNDCSKLAAFVASNIDSGGRAFCACLGAKVV